MRNRFTGMTKESFYWPKVDKRGPDECWPWLAGVRKTGYALFQRGDAHRFAYELAEGPIPEGKVIDHTCHNADKACGGGVTCPHRRCQNPAHLEAVTRLENVRRGVGNGLSKRTHCPAGHPYDAANTYVKWRRDTGKPARHCKKCATQASREHQQRTRQKAVAAGLTFRDYLKIRRHS